MCSLFAEKHSCRSVISIKLLCTHAITLRHWCSPINLLNIFKTPCYKNRCGGLRLVLLKDGSTWLVYGYLFLFLTCIVSWSKVTSKQFCVKITKKQNKHGSRRNCRSSRPEVFSRKGVLKICSKFTGKHPCLHVKVLFQ